MMSNVSTKLLIKAVQKNQEVYALKALEKGADSRATDTDGKSVLTYAAQLGHVELVRHLLAKGADPNAVSKSGEAPLRAACLRDNLEIVQLLLQYGANVNNRYSAGSMPADQPNACFTSYESVLHDAATYGSLDILRTVLAAGADLQAVGKSGMSPIMAAVDERRMDSVKVLLEAGAIVTPEEETAFAVYHFSERSKAPAFVTLVNELSKAYGAPEYSDALPGVAFFSIRLPESLMDSPSQLDPMESFRQREEQRNQLEKMVEQARKQFGDRVAQSSYLLLDCGRPIGCGPITQTLALLPTSDKYEAMFTFHLRANTQEMRCKEMVEWFRNLDREEPFDLIGLRYDTVEIQFKKPVADPDRLAREMVHFCWDLAETPEAELQLAYQLRSERRVYFWWD
ncbi:MAG: ankyrin repeat domain-containing protein [Planctomycetia bacterium]|nr:ankyrin repeat domain-containing protein [Planctomycetia bacterium]